MNPIDQSPLRDHAAAYALGALDAEEARAFEALLAGSPELRREVDEYRETNALLALGTSAPQAPNPALRAQVLERIAREKVVPLRRAPTGPRRQSLLVWAALAASLVAVVGLGVSVRELRRQLGERDAALASLGQELADRNARLTAREATLNALLEPGVRLSTLVSAADPMPGMQLFVNPRRNIAIAHAFNLKPAGAGRAYQLWFIPKAGKPIPSVTFNSEADGHAMVEQIVVPTGVDLTAAAITDEPASGSPQPTTPVLLVGALQS
ncbi:MAG: anti-sigma factor [Gemmatimonadales bacterium]